MTVSPVHPLTLRASLAASRWGGEGCFEVLSLVADQRDDDNTVAAPESFGEAPEGDAYQQVLPASPAFDGSVACEDDAEHTVLTALLSSQGAAPLAMGGALRPWRNATVSPDDAAEYWRHRAAVNADWYRRRDQWRAAYRALVAQGAAHSWHL